MLELQLAKYGSAELDEREWEKLCIIGGGVCGGVVKMLLPLGVVIANGGSTSQTSKPPPGGMLAGRLLGMDLTFLSTYTRSIDGDRMGLAFRKVFLIWIYGGRTILSSRQEAGATAALGDVLLRIAWNPGARSPKVAATLSCWCCCETFHLPETGTPPLAPAVEFKK
jgi:hypothetical protein